MRVIIRPSARRHGISDEDMTQAANWPHLTAPLDQDHPQRQLRLGFDTKTRLLEIVVLIWDDGTEEIIHAMKARKPYPTCSEPRITWTATTHFSGPISDRG